MPTSDGDDADAAFVRSLVADGTCSTAPDIVVYVREQQDAARLAYDYADDEAERARQWSSYLLYSRLCRMSPRRIRVILGEPDTRSARTPGAGA